MKLINPVNRELGTGLEANIQVRACMCSITPDNFSSGQGADTCARCGCRCNGNVVNDSANDTKAVTTNRTS